MSRTDLVADTLTIIRNANMVRKEKTDVPASKLNKEILRILKQEGFIENYKYIEDRKQGLLRVYLRYTKEETPVLTNLKRISKPGLRVYVDTGKIPRVLGGIGIAIISTSKGVMTDKECRAAKVGGEVLCHIW